MDILGMQDGIHSIHIACKDRARSKSDLIHRLIAHLNMSNYHIKRVTIHENPIEAKVVFRKTNPFHSKVRTLSNLFKQRYHKTYFEFTLHMKLYELDTFGVNYSLDYRFDVDRFHVEEKHKTSEDIHEMMRTVLGVPKCFAVTVLQ